MTVPGVNVIVATFMPPLRAHAGRPERIAWLVRGVAHPQDIGRAEVHQPNPNLPLHGAQSGGATFSPASILHSPREVSMFRLNRRAATVAAVVGALTVGSAGAAFAADPPATKADIKADTAKVKRDKTRVKQATGSAKTKASKTLKKDQADLKQDRAGG
jgi:hypothetical protein